MQQKSKNTETVKSSLHKRNKNNERYNFKLLIEHYKELAPFVKPNKFNDDSIEFANPAAVKALNKAILIAHYDTNFWDIPDNYLCPPIPGRADYLHYIADLLCESNYGKIPMGSHIKGMDIGVGANCIYPIIGTQEYQWSFIGTDIDPIAVESANLIIDKNPSLKEHVEIRLQENAKDFFYGVLDKNEQIDFTICNPPFHASAEDAQKGTLRKLSNLNQKKVSEVSLNFGGQSHELWYDGGEKRFVLNMIKESKKFATNCFWFSTLVSKQSNLNAVYERLKQINVVSYKIIPMSTGNKSSRIIAWTFLDTAQQKEWKDTKWNKK